MSAFKTWLNGLTGKTTPVDADEMYLRDSVGAASNKVTWANLKATLKTYFDGLYLALVGGDVAVPDGTTIGGTSYKIAIGSNFFVYANNSVPTIKVWNAGMNMNAGYCYAWGSSNCSSEDLLLYRDAAGTLAQRNGTNAQTYRTYGTYTDASNYRRVALAMTTAGVATLAPEGAGTGASGNVLHISGLPTSNPGAGILWNDSGTVKVGT